MCDILKVSSVAKTFGLSRKRRRQTAAVVDVSLTLERGETLGIVGDSGCGKTTLARLITGLLRPDRGRVLFEGRDLNTLTNEEMRRVRPRLRMIFQSPDAALNPGMTVREILQEAVKMGTNGCSLSVPELCGFLGLNSGHLKRLPYELSGGEKRLVTIGRAIATCPTLLVADEAVSGLDISRQGKILQLVLEIQENTKASCLYISHNISAVSAVSSNVMVMYGGYIVELLASDILMTEDQDHAKMEFTTHPYTAELIRAANITREEIEKPEWMCAIPSVSNKGGCPFQGRCRLRRESGSPEACREEVPELRSVGEGHQVRCHLVV